MWTVSRWKSICEIEKNEKKLTKLKKTNKYCLTGDGNVSFEEFVNILSNMTDATAESSADQEERELRDAFRVFDKHNRGYITASDLRAVLQCLGEDLDEDESKLILQWEFQVESFFWF